MGFENKYRLRDLKIPEQREILLKKIQQDLINDENILSFFYCGSIENENTDIYSDIDLRSNSPSIEFNLYFSVEAINLCSDCSTSLLEGLFSNLLGEITCG